MTISYIVHNYSRPLKVVIEKNVLHVYRSEKSVLELKLTEKPFPVKNPKMKPYTFIPKNTMLIPIGVNYLFLGGDQQYIFQTPEPIKSYYSPIGNSEVPYPWAVSENYIYLMIEKVAIPKTIIGKQDPYTVYYTNSSIDTKKIKIIKNLKL